MLLLLTLLACVPEEPPAGFAATLDQPPPPSPTPDSERVALPPGEAPQHAILIVLDTLRGDALAQAHTPVLDGLAARGDQVPRAWSAGTWTIPGTLSLLTGMSVREHGADLPMGHAGEYPPIPDVPTLASVMAAHGFTTTGLYANNFLTPELGFDQGFDTWRHIPDRAMPRYLAEEVSTWEPGQRHFVYLHLLATHSPLRPSDEARRRWEVDASWFDERLGLTVGAAKRNRRDGVREAYRAAYMAVLEDTDALVGELLEVLSPITDEAVVVVTADHGELLGEHDVCGHGYWVHEPLTHVPLVASGLGELPDTLVTTSVPALVTEALGVPHTWPTPARPDTPLVSQREGKLALSLDGRHKAVWDEDLQVFDLEADPGEEHPLSGEHPELVAAREAWEARTPRGTLQEGRVELAQETQDALRILGYLEDDSPQ